MKIPLFSKLTAKSRGRKVVRASARAMRGGEEDYYEAEPNMKLSHAFMVVLILHVVAVGGIYAFNQIKVNRKPDLIAAISGKITEAASNTLSTLPAPQARTTPAELRPMPEDADEPLPVVESVAAAPAAAAPVVTSKPPVPAAPVVTQTSPAKAAPKPAEVTKVATTTAAAPSAAGTYKVAKGDNPYKIAKKLGVSYQELLKVNGIEDPTKLQIDQVLKVPSKAN